MKDEDLHFDINDLLKLLPIENNKIKETFYIRVTIKKEVNNEQ